MNDEMIDAISKADYGYKAESSFSELKEIITEKVNPSVMSTHLHEVLSLYRWSKPENKQEHTARALSCFYLLNLNENTTYGYWDDETTLGILLESILELGDEFYRPALRFIAWKILEIYDAEVKFYEEEGDDPGEIKIEDHFNSALLFLMLLNKRPEEDIKIIFNHFGHRDKNPAERFYAFLEASESLTRPEVWKTVMRKILPETGYLEDDSFRKTLESAADRLNNKNT
jgi:hypothetical protein